MPSSDTPSCASGSTLASHGRSRGREDDRHNRQSGDGGGEREGGPHRPFSLGGAGVRARRASQDPEDLDKLSHVTAEELLPLLGQQDAYEAGFWVDILRSRVEAIDQFRNLTER